MKCLYFYIEPFDSRIKAFIRFIYSLKKGLLAGLQVFLSPYAMSKFLTAIIYCNKIIKINTPAASNRDIFKEIVFN